MDSVRSVLRNMVNFAGNIASVSIRISVFKMQVFFYRLSDGLHFYQAYFFTPTCLAEISVVHFLTFDVINRDLRGEGTEVSRFQCMSHAKDGREWTDIFSRDF